MKISQEGRWLKVDTPLGDDVFILTGFEGEESLSRPYSFSLTMMADKDRVAPSDILGKSITVTLHRHGGTRLFNGIVKRFGAGPMVDRTYREFHAEIVPWLWLLTRNTNCRIFQQKSAVDIITAVFDAAGQTNYSIAGLTKSSYSTREYCVQYRETDFNFVSRLMEEEGIFYYFKHESGKNTLMLADKTSAYTTADEAEVEYRSAGEGYNVVSQWRPAHEYRSGKVTHRDWDFVNVSVLSSTTSTVADVAAFKKHELYDYPGNFTVNAGGDALAKVHMEEEEAGHAECWGASTCASFVPGAKFTLSEHDAGVEIGGYVLAHVRHTASDRTVLGGGGPTYGNEFRCLPAATTFRPPRVTPKALVHGPQTAIVVGPSGEEIYCDSHGRIKVQFHWDRDGQSDESSSCWIRVAQMLAGSSWGTQFLPRIKMEVIVEFLEGDPDRPLVTGCVYNGVNTTPYALPADKTKSGFKSRSSSGGTSTEFNELRFEDKLGSEEVYFHAQKDFTRVVENNDTLTVTQNQTETIEKGNRTVTLDQGNDNLTVSTGNRTVKIQGNRDVTVVGGNDTLTVNTGAITIKALSKTVTVEAAQSIELKVGASSIKLEPSSIKLTIGGSSIELTPSAITDSSPSIKLDASAQLSAQGAITEVKASGVVTISGALVKIN